MLFRSLQATLLSGTDGAIDPFFSPDGHWIAFFTGEKLKKISVTGGAAVIVADARNEAGGSWSDDGTIVFAEGPSTPTVRLVRVSSAGGAPEIVATPDATYRYFRWPQMLPSGKAVLFTVGSPNTSNTSEYANLVVQSLPAGARTVVRRGGYYGRYVPSGHLVYIHEGTLFAAPFDLDRLDVTGQAVRSEERRGGKECRL